MTRSRYVMPERRSDGPGHHIFLWCPTSGQSFHIDDASSDPCWQEAEAQEMANQGDISADACWVGPVAPETPNEEDAAGPSHVIWSSVSFESFKTSSQWLAQARIQSVVTAMLDAEREGLVDWAPFSNVAPAVVSRTARSRVASVVARIAANRGFPKP